MKDIDTLVQDMYGVVESIRDGKTINIAPQAITNYRDRVTADILSHVTPRTRKRKEKTLYFSEIGKPCLRQVYYGFHEYPKEPLRANTLIKFGYGDYLETYLMFLAEVAGHEVTDYQKRCTIELKDGWKVSGRLDFKVDGVLVDAKSASTYAFKKFSEGTLITDDAFGYMGQLAGYSVSEGVGQAEDHTGNRAGFLAIEKQNGDICFYEPELDEVMHSLPDLDGIVDAMESDEIPDRGFEPEPYQQGGNMVLGVNCSYCAFKDTCWADACGGKGIRTFIYGGRPKFHVHIEKEPRVFEVKNEL